MNWLQRATKRAQMAGHEPYSTGTPDGGLGIGGKLFPGQATALFGRPEDFAKKKRKKDVHKKNRRKKPERPGEQEHN